jgi:hypothetical protein
MYLQRDISAINGNEIYQYTQNILKCLYKKEGNIAREMKTIKNCELPGERETGGVWGLHYCICNINCALAST